MGCPLLASGERPLDGRPVDDTAQTLVTYHLPDGRELYADAWREGGEVVIEVSDHGIEHRVCSLEELDLAIDDVVAWEPIPGWNPDDTEVHPETRGSLRAWLDQGRRPATDNEEQAMRQQERDAVRAYLSEHGVPRANIDEIVRDGTAQLVDGVCVVGFTQDAAIEYHDLALKVADRVAGRLKSNPGLPVVGKEYVDALRAREPDRWGESPPTREQATAQERLRQRGFLVAAHRGLDAYREVTGAPVVWDPPKAEAETEASADG